MRKKLAIIHLRLRRMGLVLLAIAIVSTIGAVLMQRNDLLGVEGQELGAYDGGLNFWTKKAERSKDITLVLIDEKTFSAIDSHFKEKFGTWPYQRLIWAYLLRYFADSGVRAVAFDFLMTEKTADDDMMISALKEMEGQGIPFFTTFDVDVERTELPKIQPVNRSLHNEISRQIEAQIASAEHRNPISADAPFPDEDDQKTKAPDPNVGSTLLLSTAQALSFPIEAHGFSLPHFIDDEVLDEEGKHVVKTRPLFPNPPISSLLPHAQFGLATTELDIKGNDDGKMRRTAFGYCDTQNCYATLSVVMAASLLKAEKVVLTKKEIQIGSRHMAIDDDGTAGIHYGGRFQDRFKNHSMIYLLDDALRRESLRGKGPLPKPKYLQDLQGKIVFVALGKGDNRPTPFEKEPPAVIKHASELENLLHGRMITDAPYVVSVVLAIVLALLSVLVILVAESAFLEIGWPILVFFGFYLIPGYFLSKYQIHVLSVMPSLAGSFASVLASAYKGFFAEKQREELKSLFSSYMEKELVDQMVEGKTLPSLSGEIKQITVLYSDLVDFSKKIDQAGLDVWTRMKILNRYLDTMSKILVKEGACLDKYVGHEIYAFFGTPIVHQDHAIRACRAALLMKQADEELRAEFEAQGWPQFQSRIAVHTDEVLVGNMGSEQLIDYTAIGDGIEGAILIRNAVTKYKGSILISEKTYQAAQPLINAHEVGKELFPGQKEKTAVYALVSIKTE